MLWDEVRVPSEDHQVGGGVKKFHYQLGASPMSP